jgi:hypothetical protein
MSEEQITFQQTGLTPTMPVVEPEMKQYPAKKKIVTVLASLIVTASLALAGYLYYQNIRLRSQLMVTPTPIPAATEQSKDTSAEWNTYSNPEIGFSVDYPANWRVVEHNNGVGFGSKEVGEDTIVGLSYYPQSEYQPSSIIDQFGKQFKDRVVKSDFVIVDKRKVGKITVTTPSTPDWYLESVIFENPNYFIVASNGAVKDENYRLMIDRGVPKDFTFEKFYSTFRLTDPQQNSNNKVEKKIGYIKSIKPNYDSYLLNIDFIDYISDSSAPNGYRIENPSTSLSALPTDLSISNTPAITLMTYPRTKDGGMIEGVKEKNITFSQFTEAFDANTSIWDKVPFWIETSRGTITKITEQYIP